MNRALRPRIVAAGAILAFAGCGEEERMSAPPPPPAAMIAPVRETMSLDEKLERLEQELAAAIRGRLEGDAELRMIRAEAITDRLLEAQMPVEWLGEQYLLEARLRQLQTRADLVVAQLRRGVDRNRVLPHARELYRSVIQLRAALREPGGGEAPPPLDSLLARYGAEPAEPEP